MNKVIALILLLAMPVQAGQFGVDWGQRNSMRALYHLNEGSGSTTYDDINGFTGAITGSAWVTGKFGTALQFSGSPDYCELATGEAIFGSTNPDEWSVCFWAQLTSPTFGMILGDYNGTAPGDTNMGLNFSLGDFSANMDFWFRRPAGYYSVVALRPQTIGKWYFVAGSVSKLTGKAIYMLNTELQGTTTIDTTNDYIDATPIRIGAQLYNSVPNNFGYAKVDEVAFFNKAYPASFWRTIYAMQVGSYIRLSRLELLGVSKNHISMGYL